MHSSPFHCLPQPASDASRVANRRHESRAIIFSLVGGAANHQLLLARDAHAGGHWSYRLFHLISLVHRQGGEQHESEYGGGVAEADEITYEEALHEKEHEERGQKHQVVGRTG